MAGELPNGLPFELQVADRPDVMWRSITEEREWPSVPIIASRTAFWVGFLVDPDKAVSLLRPGITSRYSWGEIARVSIACYNLWGRPETPTDEGQFREPAPLWSVCYPDLINFAAILLSSSEWEDAIVAIANNVRGREVRSSLGLPDPLILLVNNILSPRLLEGDTATVQRLRTVLARLLKPTELTGLLRFVL